MTLNTISSMVSSGWRSASVGQARDLRESAEWLGIDINCGFADVVMAPPRGAATRDVEGLAVTVVWPDQERVYDLRDEWHRERARVAEEAADG